MSERDMLNWAMQIVAAEELARARIVVEPKVEVTPTTPVRTVASRKVDFKIPGTIIDINGAGCLRELVMKSTFKDYRLHLYVDGQVVYANTWDEFNELSQEIEDIAAFQSVDGLYVLHLADVKFTENIKAIVEPARATTDRKTINYIFYKVDVTQPNEDLKALR